MHQPALRRASLLPLIAALALAACAAGGGTGGGDGDGGGGGPRPDADPSRPVDAATDRPDADPSAPDAAPPPIDAAPPPIDAAPPPIDASTAECVAYDDCGAGRGCLTGVCRNECFLGIWCDGMPSGDICRGGLCVECQTDADCDSGRLQCDTSTFTCVDRPFDPTTAQFGIFYSTWHCIAANANPVRDISRILAGQQGWGAYGQFHYWDQPAPGYYCPSNNDAVLRQHAELLRDAGIQFVFLDATNHAYVDARSHDTPGMILQPLDRLLAVWSTVTNAPKVVPWVPVVEAGSGASTYTVDAMMQRINAYPSLRFLYLGKPLLLITENSQYPVNATREAQLAASYTVRRMWGVYGSDGEPWSFMQRCQDDPTASERCDQRVAVRGGEIEQIPIAAAYQATFMNVSTATPKHRGLTFRKQFEQAFRWPETPIITITGWNEWIAQRQQCGHEACPCSQYPDGCFIDQWDVEYSRDIEPGANEMGTYYYDLMRACIALFRAGQECDADHAGDVCCRAWTP
jgi:hypothetical protein